MDPYYRRPPGSGSGSIWRMWIRIQGSKNGENCVVNTTIFCQFILGFGRKCSFSRNFRKNILAFSRNAKISRKCYDSKFLKKNLLALPEKNAFLPTIFIMVITLVCFYGNMSWFSLIFKKILYRYLVKTPIPLMSHKKAFQFFKFIIITFHRTKLYHERR